MSEAKLNRWIVEGTLTTLTPLHIGDGEFDLDPKSSQQIARVQRPRPGDPPYIPGSSFRGFLRSCFEDAFPAAEVNDLFGFQHLRQTGNPAEASGGLLSVQDAFIKSTANTEVLNHVVINRRTRTAAEHLLYAIEVVPAGTTFFLTLVVEGLRAKPDAISKLLAVLRNLQSSGRRLGAGTADNMGKLSFSETAVRQLTPQALQAWVKKGGHLNEHLTRVSLPPLSLPTSSKWLYLDIELRFTGKFLVRDAVRSKDKARGLNLNASSIEARRTRDGRALLDASSFFGPLRSQCERIARTIAGPAASSHVRNVEITPDSGPAKVIDLNDATAVDCLFGGIGWLSPIQIEKDFEATTVSPPTKQEFLAIDRFTGGGVDGLKYDACGFDRPTLQGRLKFDLDSLRYLAKEGRPPAVFPGSPPSFNDLWLLLAFTLRDLVEGDVYFGLGASKGFGACSASISWPTSTSNGLPASFIEELSRKVSNV